MNARFIIYTSLKFIMAGGSSKRWTLQYSQPVFSSLYYIVQCYCSGMNRQRIHFFLADRNSISLSQLVWIVLICLQYQRMLCSFLRPIYQTCESSNVTILKINYRSGHHCESTTLNMYKFPCTIPYYNCSSFSTIRKPKRNFEWLLFANYRIRFPYKVAFYV